MPQLPPQPQPGLADLPPELGIEIVRALAPSMRPMAALARSCRTIHRDWFADGHAWAAVIFDLFGQESVPEDISKAPEVLRHLLRSFRGAEDFYGAWIDDH
ncbi:hypothetical protein HK405_012427, partial [Cladochytrium tenue]